VRPKASNLIRVPTHSIIDLDEKQLEKYKVLISEYQNKYNEWKYQNISLTSLHQYIRDHITLPNHNIISESTSVWHTLQLLQDRNQPTEEAANLVLQQQWQSLFLTDVKSQDWRTLLDRIRTVYDKVKKAKLPEANGKMPLYQVINLLYKIDRV
jgi:DNA-directed RNA polymerase subunit H (RpoH/RPB5)